MRLHVIGLPHTAVTEDYAICAYTDKCRRFANMMSRRGHEVYLYSPGATSAECAEHIQLPGDIYPRSSVHAVDWNAGLPLWRQANLYAAAEIGRRLEPDDIICLTSGSQWDVIGHLRSLGKESIVVEWTVGYKGVVAPYRVYESYAAMHALFGWDLHTRDYDTVIPPFFDPQEFQPLPDPHGGQYLFFMGRLDAAKGLDIAETVSERIGMELIVAGPGTYDGPGTYVGILSHQDRNAWMQHAYTTLCPTQYMEPGCNVHLEAMMNGCPIVTSDYGIFTETVAPEFRCRSLSDYVTATWECINQKDVRLNALRRFSFEVIGPRYESYFRKLIALHNGKDWYSYDPVTEA